MSSVAQINANRANSQSSTGPTTDTGKAKSSHNAVKSALTGQTVLLPTDDIPAYQKLSQSMIDLHRPATYHEELLVQSLIDTEWRLRRIPALEAGIYAIGHLESADLPIADPATLDAQIFFKFERQLKNLSLQETRLRRNYQNDLARLRALQTERQEVERQEVERQEAEPAAAKPASAKPAAAPVVDNPEIGFEFSNAPRAAEPRASAA